MRQPAWDVDLERTVVALLRAHLRLDWEAFDELLELHDKAVLAHGLVMYVLERLVAAEGVLGAREQCEAQALELAGQE